MSMHSDHPPLSSFPVPGQTPACFARQLVRVELAIPLYLSLAERRCAPSVLLHGRDDYLLAEGAYRLHEAISGEKLLRMVPGADHGLTWHRESELPLLWDSFADHLRPESSRWSLLRDRIRTAR